MRIPVLVALAVITASGAARAQVNTEPFRAKIKHTGYSFFLQGTFDGHTGNTYGLTADGLVGAGVSRGRNLVFAIASVDYSKLNGALGVDKSFAHLRYDYAIRSWVSWEAFAQAQSDVFELIKIRDLVGVGPRFALYDDPHFALFFGVAYMLERDVYDVSLGGPVARVQEGGRASTYLTAHATLTDGIDAVTTTYVQPAVEDPSDIRILSESGFVFKVKAWLSTAISFVAHYDSNPAPGVLPTDAELKNSIVLTL
jgi:hypothetical protein